MVVAPRGTVHRLWRRADGTGIGGNRLAADVGGHCAGEPAVRRRAPDSVHPLSQGERTAGQTTTTNASSTTTRPSTLPPIAASRRNISPRPPITPSSSSSTKWAWKIRTCAASWASPKRPSAPQGTGLCRIQRSEYSLYCMPKP